MPRSRNKVASRNRRRRMMQHAKGYWGLRSHVWTIAKNHVEKGWTHAFRDRRLKKRQYRRLWIVRINAAAREHGLSYSAFMQGLEAAGVTVDRKMLADLATTEPAAFAALAARARDARPAAAASA